jgi:hypothetical protein
MRRSYFRMVFVLMIPLGPGVSQGQVYFSTSWCPRPEEITELSKYLKLEMNGCCIRRGYPTPEGIANPNFIERFSDHTLSSDYPNAACDGHVLTVAEEVEAKLARNEAQRADAAEELRIAQERSAEQLRIAQQRKTDAPALLRKLGVADFCISLGNALRGEQVDALELDASKDVVSMVKAEAVHRNVLVNSKRVQGREIWIGMSECELFASWGPPSKRNRTVGVGGTHVQNVYESQGTYVYTENGRVTAWQD